MRTDLIALLDRIARDDAIRAVVVTGQGKAFCAGGDIAGMRERMDGAGRRGRLQRLAPPAARPPHACRAAHHAQADHRRRQRRRPPASAATWRWPATSSSRATAPASPGLHPPRHHPRWRRHVLPAAPRRPGQGQGADLHRPQGDADEALALGIVDRKTTPRHPAGRRAGLGRRAVRRARATALALAKTILNQTFELPVEQVFAQGSQAQGICYTSTEHRESVLAFLAKSAAAKGMTRHGRDRRAAPARAASP